jgi:hypothetical protein
MYCAVSLLNVWSLQTLPPGISPLTVNNKYIICINRLKKLNPKYTEHKYKNTAASARSQATPQQNNIKPSASMWLIFFLNYHIFLKGGSALRVRHLICIIPQYFTPKD